MGLSDVRPLSSIHPGKWMISPEVGENDFRMMVFSYGGCSLGIDPSTIMGANVMVQSTINGGEGRLPVIPSFRSSTLNCCRGV